MDTREKLIPLAALPAMIGAGQWSVVAGLFDPLTAESAAWITEVADAHPGCRILVLVLPAEESLLPSEARAALVAALRRVDLVAIGDPAALAPALHGNIMADPARDHVLTRQFVELVQRRAAAR